MLHKLLGATLVVMVAIGCNEPEEKVDKPFKYHVKLGMKLFHELKETPKPVPLTDRREFSCFLCSHFQCYILGNRC